jgi:hydrogenase-4 membrane subunit HyfE
MAMRLMSSYNNERCGLSTCCLGLVLGVIAAVIFGILFFFGLIPVASLGVDIALEVAVIVLILLFVGAYLSEVNPTYFLARCLCRHAACLLAGIIGTIAASTIALSILLAPGLISSAIAVAVVVFFYTLMLTETAGFLLCFACKAHRCKENE